LIRRNYYKYLKTPPKTTAKTAKKTRKRRRRKFTSSHIISTKKSNFKVSTGKTKSIFHSFSTRKIAMLV